MSEHQIFAKCAWRLMPLVVLAYVVNYLDRTNVGFAALTMNKDLGFTPETFGFGAGVFFVGYLLFQVPANFVLSRVGARIWISLILAAWGAVSASTAFVQGPMAFASMRFLLGVAEAGFFPGMMFYLTLWFPKAYRAQLSAFFIVAQPLAFIVGGPLSTRILGMNGIAGFHGWQWLFLIEGIPAIVIAVCALQWLPDGPERAEWLDADEKRTISARLGGEAQAGKPETLLTAMLDHRVWLIAVPIFAAGSAQYGVALWLPQIVSAMGYSNSATGLVVALTYFAAMIAIVAVAFSSDRQGERLWHVVVCWSIAAAGFIGASVSPSDSGVLIGLTLANAAILANIAPLYALPTGFLTGQACAGAIALMNVFASLGGFVAPILIGVLRTQSGNYKTAMASLAIGLVLAVLILLAFRLAMARHLALSHSKMGSAA